MFIPITFRYLSLASPGIYLSQRLITPPEMDNPTIKRQSALNGPQIGTGRGKPCVTRAAASRLDPLYTKARRFFDADGGTPSRRSGTCNLSNFTQRSNSSQQQLD